jgi:hypothetical protein
MRVSCPLLLVLSLATSLTSVEAQVYQSVGPDGRPVFTDRPLPNARQLDIPLNRAPEPAAEEAQAAPTDGAAGFLGPYEMLEVVTPADEHRTRDTGGELPVSLVIAPALLDGHRLAMEVDGVVAEGDVPNPSQVMLRGLTLGTHRIRAIVQDGDGAAIAATPAINVHVLPPLPESAEP